MEQSGDPESSTKAEIITRRAAGFVHAIKTRLFEMAFWKFYLMVLLIAMLQNGVWYSPLALQYWMMSTDILHNPFVSQNNVEWVLSAFLGPALAYFLHMNGSVLAYCILQLSIFLLGFTALIFIIRRRNGDYIARCLLLVFFLSPLPNILFTSLGTPDVMTALLAIAVAAFWEELPVVFVGSLLLGVNHPEQANLIVLLMVLFSLFTRRLRQSAGFALYALGGLVLGEVLLQWFLSSHNFDIVFTRLDYVMGMGLGSFIESGLSEPFALLYSLFSLTLPFVVAYLLMFGRKNRIAPAFMLCSLIALASMLFAFDQTRVFSLMTFPLLCVLVLAPAFQRMQSSDAEFFKALLAASFIAGILIPRFVVWNGSVSSSVYPHILKFLHDQYGVFR